MTASDGGFGPVGPAAGGTPPFAVSGPAQVSLDASRAGVGSFAVSNVTGRPVRARLSVVPAAGADPAWFQIVGESERALPVAGNATVDVQITVAPKVHAGAHSFTLSAALEDDPNQVVSGPTVAFTIPEGKKKRFPWWIVIVAAAVLLVGGGLTFFFLTRPGPEPSPSPSPSPTSADPPIFREGDFIASPNRYIDLDEGRLLTEAGTGADVYFYQGAGSGELGLVGQGQPRVSTVEEPTYSACENATDYDDLNAQNIAVLPGPDPLYVCVRFTDQSRMSLMTIGPMQGAAYPVSFVTWTRD